VRELLEQRGFDHVSISSEIAATIKLLPRAQTTVVNAYLSPLIGDYLERVRANLDRSALLVMTSAGGLLDPAGFRPKDSLLSGPAGGVVGAARAGLRSGEARVISFDMGGTSTDVARYDEDFEYVWEHEVGDAHLVAPALGLETVAAGGGSVLWLDGERLRVGPRSAGAEPGPACYGAGGPLTLTDVNLLLGRLVADRFGIPVQSAPAAERLRVLAAELERRTGRAVATEALLEGALAIANETMADAIRRISVRRGYDPGEYALVCFGGAGGQHACGVADQLGIRRVIVPTDAALLSARGLAHARVERFVERQVLEPIAEAEPRIAGWVAELSARAIAEVEAAGVPRDRIEVRRRLLHLRFLGQESSLTVDWAPDTPIAPAFVERYRTLFGHRPEKRPVELESLRVVVSSVEEDEPSAEAPAAPATVEAEERHRCYASGDWLELPLHERERLPPGARIDGPALVVETHSCVVVEPGWSAAIDGAGSIVLDRRESQVAHAGEDHDETGRPEAVRLELFTQRFHSLVREMGEQLERTSVSTNVKERLDFSCALLDPTGELVVNAPHIPVHLGALGECVRSIWSAMALGPEDVVVTNHPAFGGSHLPDVTVVAPVFVDEDGGKMLGYLASRAHHAEIGGVRPGSMPPTATRLAEEGVVLAPDYLLRHGRPRWDELRRRLLAGAHPTRSIEDNLADLRAAVAASLTGAAALRRLAARHGPDTVLHYMAALKGLAEERMREALGALPDGRYEAAERLDDGSPIRVRIDLSGTEATIDFAGSAAVHPGNLNATPAIVRSAVLYVLRLLIDEPLPLNEGLLRPVRLVVPRGMLNPGFPDDARNAPAVVGGNVETSQRIVDTLIKALGLAACSQGTMNNLIFGNPRFGYYETLGGGCGAGPGFDGASAVHSHMTNTRITDPEVVEHRYPVRVERFAVRRGSGGSGKFRGGDGLVRELSFLEPVSLSVLSQHRNAGPFGVDGGEAGARGVQRVVRRDGSVEQLGAIDGRELEAGDRVVVETPGGGGWGSVNGSG
jgi:5-oxoprolinase (ATP-hydrolysing)